MRNNVNMPIISIDTSRFESFGVRPDEVCATVLFPGDILWCNGEMYTYDTDVALIVDQLHQDDDGSWNCTMIRQVLPIPDWCDGWGQEWVDPCPPLREMAREFNLRRVTVPGGIPPLILEGTVAVPDFSTTGTS